jgi:hypothetical protein
MRNAAAAMEADPHFQGPADMLGEALRLFLGWDRGDPLPVAEELCESAAALPNAVISWNTSSTIAKQLALQGHTRQHRFSVLPSRARARWCLPLTADRTAVNGFKLYTPFSPAARLMKAVVTGIRGAGLDGWAWQTVLIASRTALPIEDLVSPITKERDLTFALSIGTPGMFQKLTVQVMRQDGKILGYLKMPMTDEAQGRLRHEAAILQKLAAFPALRKRIPQVLFAGCWNSVFILLQSALEGEVGPLRLTDIHAQFLRDLHGCEPTSRPGRTLVHEVERRWNRAVSKLCARWQDLGRETIKIAARELDTSQVSCGIQHGDFAPWNMRVHRGDLFLFDWEYASWDTPILWDQFHFMAQTEAFLNKSPVPKYRTDIRNTNRAVYMLYLLDSAARLSEETPDLKGVNYREKQLLRHISELEKERVSRLNRGA